MLSGFTRYNEEIAKFEASKLFQTKYDVFCVLLRCATRETPLLSREIEKELDIPGSAVRSLARHARLNGKPICSNQNGYFYATTREELQSTLEHLRQRASIMLEMASRMEAVFRTPTETNELATGQMEMF